MGADVIGRLRESVRDLTERALRAGPVVNPSLNTLRRFVQYELFIAPHDVRALSMAVRSARQPDEYEFLAGLVAKGPSWISRIEALARELGVGGSLGDLPPLAVGYTMLLSWLGINGTPGDIAVLVGVNFDTFCANSTRLADWAAAHGVRGAESLRCRGLDEERLEAAERIAERYLDWDRYLFIARAAQTFEALFWESLA